MNLNLKNVIITGASGMVGKAVLLECLEDDRIGEVLLINRKSLGLTHPKIKELLIGDFSKFSKNDLPSLIGGRIFDACFFCMGVSVVGMSEEMYHSVIYEITKLFADELFSANPEMIFNYVSGEGTDSSEQGKIMWARVKGKAENAVFTKGFKDAYAFRPGIILPEKGIKSNTSIYNIGYMITWPLFPLFRRMKNVTTTTLFGKGMINTLFYPQAQKILENFDINILSRK